MRRRPCILGRGRRCLSGEVGREALVERLDGNVQPRAQRRDERLRLERLIATLALQGQRQPDDYALSLFGSNERGQPLEARVGRRSLDHAQGPRERAAWIGHGHAGPRCAEVQGEHLHARRVYESASTRAALPASSASRRRSGCLPPASASVARPPPPPPMYEPSCRTTATASRPRSGSDRSKLTTSEALPSSTEPSTTASALFCRRSPSERSRNVAPRAPFTSATNTSPCSSSHTRSGPSTAFGFRASFRPRSAS